MTVTSSVSQHRLDTISEPEKNSDDEHSTSRLDADTFEDKEEFSEWKPVFTGPKRKPSKQWAPMSKSIVEKLLDNSTDHFNEAATTDVHDTYASSGYDYDSGEYGYSDSEEEDDDDERVTRYGSVHDEDSEDEVDPSMPKATPIDPVRVQKKQDLKQVFARLELRFGDILKCVAIILALVLPFHDFIADGFNSLVTGIAKPISASMQQNVDGMLATPVPSAVKSVALKPASPVVHPVKYLSMVSVKQKASTNGAVHHKAAPPAQVMIEVDPTTPRRAYQSW